MTNAFRSAAAAAGIPPKTAIDAFAPTLDLGRLGGSDVPHIPPFNRITGKSPLTPWGRIVLGLSNDQDEFMEWGQILERPIAEKMARRRGWTIIQGRSTNHPAREWQRYTPDFFIPELGALAEVKCRAPWQKEREGWGDPGTDQVPPSVLLQVQTYLEAAGMRRCFVWVLFGGNEGVEYIVPYDPDLGALIVSSCERFWCDHIITGIPPAWDGSEEATRALTAMHPERGPVRDASPTECAVATRYAAACALLETVTRERDRLGQELRAAIGGDRGLRGPFGRLTWSTVRGRERTDWGRAFEFLAESAGVRPGELSAELNARGFVKHSAPSRMFRPTWSKEIKDAYAGLVAASQRPTLGDGDPDEG